MAKEIPHVLVIGGGFGGLALAKNLARFPVRITIVDKKNHHLFQPLLYQVATAGLSPSEIAYPLRSVFRSVQNVTVLKERVITVDLNDKQVVMECGNVTYDYLVVAVGARNNYFGRDAWKQHAIGLKDLADALEIRKRVILAFEKAELTDDPEERSALMNFVIVGGGATGVEMAGALAELAEHALACDFRKINPRDARVILVEGTGGILPGFSEMLRVDSLSQLAALGVEVKLNTFVEDITASGVKTKEEFIEARTVIWCAGVAANSLTHTLGAELDRAGRILVEPDLSIKDFPDAFAVGDCASFLHSGGRPLPGTASVAIQQGRFLAKNIGNIIRGLPRQQFEYVDQGSLATIGRSKAIAEFGRIKLSGPIAWLTWCIVHIFFLIGFRNRFSVMTEWVWQYLSYSRGARVVVEKEPEA